VFLSLGRYLCRWTIISQWYHPPSSQCFYHWVDISAGGLLFLDGIIHPVVRFFFCTDMLYYVYLCLKFTFLNNVTIIETKVNLSQEYVIIAAFGKPVQTLWLICSPQSFDYERIWWRLFQRRFCIRFQLCCLAHLFYHIVKINAREYRRFNQKWTL
jgi:hypothetical protein